MFENLLGITAALAEEAASAGADAAAEAEMGTGSTVAALVTTFLPMVLIFVVFYFFLIDRKSVV